MGQDSTLSPILSILYILSVFHILENHLKNLKNPVSILSFIDDGLFIAQNKFLTVSNFNLFCSYNIVSSILVSYLNMVRQKSSISLEHREPSILPLLTY